MTAWQNKTEDQKIDADVVSKKYEDRAERHKGWRRGMKTDQNDTPKKIKKKYRLPLLAVFALLVLALGWMFVFGRGTKGFDGFLKQEVHLECVQELGGAKSVLTLYAKNDQTAIDRMTLELEGDAKTILEDNGIDTSEYEKLNMDTIFEHLKPKLQSRYAALYSIPEDQIDVNLQDSRIVISCKVEDVPAFFEAMQVPYDSNEMSISALRENGMLSGCQ